MTSASSDSDSEPVVSAGVPPLGPEGRAMDEIGGPNYAVPLPFWSMAHPQHTQVQLLAQEWAESYGLFRSETTRSKFHSLGYGRLMSYACPTADLDALRIMVEWNTYFFIFDDQQNYAMLNDRVEDYDRLQRAIRRMVASHGSAPHSGHPLVAALSDLCRRTFPRMSIAWRARFEENLHRWLDGQSQENKFRAIRKTPTVNEYVQMRRDASVVYPDIDLMEIAEQTEIPDDLYRCIPFQTLVESTADIMCWINDIHSLPVETVEGDPINLVTVLQEHDGLGPPEAVAAVSDLVASRVEDHITAIRELQERMEETSVPHPIRQAVLRCVRDQGSWAAGMELWNRTDTIRFSCGELPGPNRPPQYAEDLLTPP